MWNRDHGKEFGSYGPGIIENWLCYGTDGTTFSGDPIHTTMTNTFRTLTYLWYFGERCGVYEPWRCVE
jgi:hypothetical protein